MGYDAQYDALKERDEAIERLRAGEYLRWQWAGGPNECQHGYAEGIPCPDCDRRTAGIEKEVL